LQKNYILDTNILLHDSESMYSFEDNNVIIPFPVLEELDKFKKASGSLGANCREVIKELDELLIKGDTTEGVELDSGGMLQTKVYKNSELDFPDFLELSVKDNWIFLYALATQRDLGNAILVTKDKNLRVKALTLGIKAEDYITDKQDTSYLGYTEGKLNNSLMRDIMQGSVEFDKAKINDVFYNEYIKYSNNIIGKFCGEKIKLVKPEEIVKVYPRNTEQIMAVDALLDENVSLVTLTGQAGTGKTLLSLAAGIAQGYSKIMYIKPIVSIGNDIGYIPGTKEDKLKVWAQPLYDNLEFLTFLSKVKEFEDVDIEVEALTYSRGRNLPNRYIIVDECQNMTRHQIKTILTRAGEGTKFILIGDLDQIDVHFLDKESCGLSYVINTFKDQKISAHVHLLHGERSELASIAANIL